MTGGYIGGVSSIDRGSNYYTKQEADDTFYKIGDDTGIIHTQRFIGSSTQKQYELARAPETKNNVQLFINGAYQQNETYNVTGNMLTLGNYPIDGQELEVVILASTVYASQDNSAHNLEYDPVGNGSVILSIEDKLRTITGFTDFVINDSLICNMATVTGIHDSVLFVSGFWEHSDNGGGMFFWDSLIPKSEHNGGTIIDPLKCAELEDGYVKLEYFIPSVTGHGCWKRVYKGDPDIKWFGAKGIGTDDTFAFNYAANHNSYVLNISEGNYLIEGITVNKNKRLVFNNNSTIKLIDNSNKNLITVDSTDGEIEQFELIGGNFDGNNEHQAIGRDGIASYAKINKISNCNISNIGRYCIYASEVAIIDSVNIKDSVNGITIVPDRKDYFEQISVTNCDIECDKINIEILKSSDNINRYNSVLIESNKLLTHSIEDSISVMSCKYGLRYVDNTVYGGLNALFRDGKGGIISGNSFTNQVTSVHINNFSTLNVSGNHFNGGDNSVDAIIHETASHTFNNVYTNNHIENYSHSVGYFADENNELTFSNNTCHDAPLIILNSCNYSISNNKFFSDSTAIELHGSRCAMQSGSVIGNTFTNNNLGILFMSSPGLIIINVLVSNNTFTNVNTCMEHNKNLGSIEEISVIGNTFSNYGMMLDIVSEGDIPTTMMWKDNKGDTTILSSIGHLQHGLIVFGEKYTLGDVDNLEITVGDNARALGQQLKINFNGTADNVSLVVPKHSSPGEVFVFTPEFRYLVLEWSGRQWENVTHRYATTDHPGVIQLATYIECEDGTNETKAVAPYGLKALINDNVRILTHTWSSEKIEGWTLQQIEDAIDAIPYATTDVAGLIKIATLAEAQEGTNSEKAITPVTLRGLIDDEETYNIRTWSSEKIHETILDHAGLWLREKSDTEEECPVLFTGEGVCDKILGALISPPQLFYVPARGSLNAVSFNSLSDERYKQNIETITDPLETVKKLRGVKFDWKHTNESSYGVVAQELEKILPDLVFTSSDTGVKNVNYDGIIGFLIEAIKILSEK